MFIINLVVDKQFVIIKFTEYRLYTSRERSHSYQLFNLYIIKLFAIKAKVMPFLTQERRDNIGS